jgi:ferredoxin-fold anticodon binding domain-containing protein
VKGNIAGVKSVLRVYEANLANGFKTNKKIEKLLLLSEEELENWVKEEMG